MRKALWNIALLCAYSLSFHVQDATATTIVSIDANVDNFIVGGSGSCPECLADNNGADTILLVGRGSNGLLRSLLSFPSLKGINERALLLINATLYLTVRGAQNGFVDCSTMSTIANPSVGCTTAHTITTPWGEGNGFARDALSAESSWIHI